MYPIHATCLVHLIFLIFVQSGKSEKWLNYGLDDQNIRVRFPAVAEIFLIFIVSKTVLVPTQIPIQ
jgi:hypothetical protein